MYQALVRLPNTDRNDTTPHAGFDWRAFVQTLLRLLHASPRR